MLRRAEVGETPADDGIVEPGMKVTYKFVGDDDDEAETFLLGAREIGGPEDGVKVYSPAVAARLGHHRPHQGRHRRPTRRPTARTLKVVILDAVPLHRLIDGSSYSKTR